MTGGDAVPGRSAAAVAAAAATTLPPPLRRLPALKCSQGKLLTVGADGEGLKHIHLKGWAVEGLRPGATPAILASPARLLPAAPSKAASGGAAGEGSLTAAALHCTEWPTVTVALGLSTGMVHTLRADVAKSKVTAPVPAAQLRESGGGGSCGGITALHFVPGSGPGAAGADLHLFAVSAGRLAAFDARTGQRLLEDECGAAPGCSAVSDRGELLVAGPDAVYSYTGGWVHAGCTPPVRVPWPPGPSSWVPLPGSPLTPAPPAPPTPRPAAPHAAEEGRKAAFAVRGQKLGVAAVRHYLVAVLADEAAAAGASAQVRVVAGVRQGAWTAGGHVRGMGAGRVCPPSGVCCSPHHLCPAPKACSRRRRWHKCST